jgi:cysteine synthase
VTPLIEMAMDYHGQQLNLPLKLENVNATGSVKERTALGLLMSLDRLRSLVPWNRCGGINLGQPGRRPWPD